MSNIAVFGDISTNGVDGSSIWLQSICNLLASEGHSVFLIIRDKPIATSITDGITKDVTIINPWQQDLSKVDSEETLSPYELFSLLDALDTKVILDHVIIRAPRFLKEMHRKSSKQYYRKILAKVDAYFAKLNIFAEDYDLTILSDIYLKINRLIVQTEQMRDYAEQSFPDLVGRVIVLNPMIPCVYDINERVLLNKINNKSTIYAGKIDSNYLIEDYIDNAPLLNSLGFEARLIGSKFNTVKTDKQFKHRVTEKIIKNNVVWEKVLSRSDTMNLVYKSTFLISIRSDSFNTDNEISTKLLESIASGTLPIINRNKVNMSIVGENYPLFANSFKELYELIAEFPLTLDNYKRVLKEVQRKISKYTFSGIYDRHLQPYYTAGVAQKLLNSKEYKGKKNVLIASHDNKFINKILEQLTDLEEIDIKYDNWKATLKHDLKHSEALLDWADVILCEWAVGPAVFYSQNKKNHQTLLVRLHRFEITTEQPLKIEEKNVNQFIVVSDYIKDFCIKNYQWPQDKIAVLPQYADTYHFDREKIKGYEYNLGMLGGIPSLKRLDRCLDILEELRKTDDRYVLYIKSKMPWEVPFIWNKDSERDYYYSQFDRIENSKFLKNAVIFDSYGNDVAVWLRKIGWLLSTSDTEGCHTAVAEAMSSGSKSVIFDWPGSDNVYKLNEIFVSSQKAAEHIISNTYFEKSCIELQKEYCFRDFDLSKTLVFYVDFIFTKVGIAIN